MVYQSRASKRVQAIPRAPDGSAFKECEYCGLSVAIVLAEMHECRFKKIVEKKLKSQCWNGYFEKLENQDQPRSAVRFFVEEFMKTCKDGDDVDIDNKACEIWKNMSKGERQPFVLQADKLNSDYEKLLQQEEIELQRLDDEADSAEVGIYDKNYEGSEMHHDSGSSSGSGFFFSETN